MIMDKISYIPVLNGGCLNCVLRTNFLVNGKRPTFFTKDSIYKYNKFLVNPFHHLSLWKQIIERDLVDRKNSLVLMDSGGLQEINLGEIRHTPEEVFNFQQEYSDIGFSFDSIPFKLASGMWTGWTFDKENFLKHAKKSSDNIQVCRKLKTNENFKFYGIIQGRQYDEYKQWYDIIKDDFVNGYCLKTPSNNPLNLAETILFALENIDSNVHFLGTGNQSKSILVYYANKYLKQKITFDSSSYDIGSQFRSYLLPFMLNKKIRFVNPKNIEKDEINKELCNKKVGLINPTNMDNDEIVNKNDIMVLDNLNDICECEVCRNVGSKITEMVNENRPELGMLISTHNLIMNIKWNEYIKNIVSNRTKLIEYINFNFEPNLASKIKDSIEMIDMCVDRGSEFALNQFKDKITINKDASAQKSIWGF